MLVKDLVNMMDEIAPFALAEEYDNVGLLVGDETAEVKGVLVALDVTEAVLEEMKETGANVLIAHHPLMFSPIQQILETNYEGGLMMKMIRQNIHFIAAHTNFDAAPKGTNDALVQLFGLETIAADQFVRVAALPETMQAEHLQNFINEKLNAPIMLMGDANKKIARLGICTGAGSDYWENAKALGADALLTGEVKHHHALEATAQGMVLFQGGHFATENPGMDLLASALQNALDRVKCNVAVYRAKTNSYFVQ